jgi:hypothetical protein
MFQNLQDSVSPVVGVVQYEAELGSVLESDSLTKQVTNMARTAVQSFANHPTLLDIAQTRDEDLRMLKIFTGANLGDRQSLQPGIHRLSQQDLSDFLFQQLVHLKDPK